ncbi:MAG: GDSL-type esterase/lipase family protein [Candidatus Alcyoniella australis]|nr:GDSL-type esterase/lipase family protein [Candidatus Alcyoniella australis]
MLSSYVKRRSFLALLCGAGTLGALEGGCHAWRYVLGHPTIELAQWPPMPKGPNVTRIVCLGESTTYGTPWGNELAWPAMLEHLLHRLAPQREWQVLNAGVAGADSSDMLRILDQGGNFQADLLIVFAGNNTFYREFLEATFFPGLRIDHGEVQRSLLLLPNAPRKVRQVLRFIDAPEIGISGLLPRFLQYQREVDPQRLIKRLTDAVGLISQRCNELGTPMLVATQPVNVLSWLPFVSDPQSAPQWADQLLQTCSALADGHAAQAGSIAEQALQKFNEPLLLQSAGIAAWDQGELSRATSLLLEALDRDVNRFRGTPSLWRGLLAKAHQLDVPSLDLAGQYYDQLAAGRIEDEIFLDLVHYTLPGAMWIAREMLRGISDLGLVQGIAAQQIEEMGIATELEEFAGKSCGNVLGGLQSALELPRVFEQFQIVEQICKLAAQHSPPADWAKPTLDELRAQRPGFTALGQLTRRIPLPLIPARYGL